MIDAIRRWLAGEGDPKTRLDAEAVRAVADEAGRAAAVGQPFELATPRVVDGRTMWIVRTGGIGAAWTVEVDDTTGVAGAVRFEGGR